jgi:hypothetical protein
MDPSRIRESFDRHRAESEVSTDAYVRSWRIELGESVLQRQRVYLDKCYWIALRDVQLGRSNDSHSKRLLDALRSSVHAKRRICPISDAVFLELIKQQDAQTRLATAELIDDLSEGVTLGPQPERVSTEVAHFFYSRAGHNVFPVATLVWSRLSYVLGVQHPLPTAFSTNEQRVIQKAFFDHMWDISLKELISRLGAALPPPIDYELVAARLNEGNALHADSIKSFAQAYRAEICGSLSLAAPIAARVMEHLASQALGGKVDPSQEERESSERRLYNFLCAAIAKKEVALALRTLHIGALCHAAVRWDHQRKLTGNDLYDFHHAEAAVAYCDVFLTENPLRTLLLQGHLKIAQDFPCRIISSKAEAAEWATT